MATGPHRIVSSEEERLILVDEDDREIGSLDKAACHDGAGVLHRAFSLFLFDAAGRLLLQQRAAGKRLWPLYWSNSCCSHPRAGETMEEATARRLREELNVAAELEFVYKFAYTARFDESGSENELCWVYLGRTADPVVPNRHEIAAVRSLPAGDVKSELAREPRAYTPWFKLEWERLERDYGYLLARYTGPRRS
jgi:isopentenyl-diphosphate delta-isomerase